MRQFVKFIVVLTAFFASSAHAEDYPVRLIKATIPFGAGSAADVVPRVVFERLAAELGQPIIIENRAGAGGMLGTLQVTKAEPDGYTLLANSSALTIAPAIFSSMAFDTKELASVLMIGSSANVMIVPISRPWKTLANFVADAKAKPGTISFGSVGIGSAVHISSEKFRLAAGIEASHVPYRGGAEVITDILGGRIDFYFCPVATALPLIKDGKVRALVVSTASRVPDLPDVPTLAEAGIKNAESEIWFGVFMPARTPGTVIEKFNAAGLRVLSDPAMQASLKKLGIETRPMKPAEIDDLVRQETASNLQIIKAADIHQ
jgi:tripartite-type tricarboxylate transporter receptor subunit TctC